MRYDPNILASSPGAIEKYDFLMDTIIDVNLPEVDLDQWTASLGLDVAAYTRKTTASFARNSEQAMGGAPALAVAEDSENISKASPASTSDGANMSSQTPDDKAETAAVALSGHSASETVHTSADAAQIEETKEEKKEEPKSDFK